MHHRFEILQDLDNIESDALYLKVDLLERKRSLIIKEFNESQRRIPAGQPGGGRWANDRSADGKDGEEIPRSATRTRLAANSQEYCDEQYKRDIFQCRMVGLSGCYAQAMVRLVACERGKTIPPLNY